MDRFTDYDFGITDGAEGIELLAGWRRGAFEQVLFTQRREFKAGESYLRPGSLISARWDGEFYSFLFLHTDSGTKNRDYNNRQEMFEKIWSLRQSLDAITGGQATAVFVAMGDLNTMGRKQSGQFFEIGAQQEIDDLARDADDNMMCLLSKTHDTPWRQGPSSPDFESNLDHGLATPNITFQVLTNASGVRDAEISVGGWNHLAGTDRDNFTERISDHCSIYCEIG
jgi:hypothetical protein